MPNKDIPPVIQPVINRLCKTIAPTCCEPEMSRRDRQFRQANKEYIREVILCMCPDCSCEFDIDCKEECCIDICW